MRAYACIAALLVVVSCSAAAGADLEPVHAGLDEAELFARACDLSLAHRERRAAELVLAARGEAAARLLRTKLDAARALERQAAARLLGRVGKASDQDRLLTAARDPHPVVRQHAVRGLSLLYERLGPRARDLRWLAADPQVSTASLQAAAALCERTDRPISEDEQDTLMRAAAHGPASARRAACVLLGHARYTQAAEHALKDRLAEDTDAAVRAAACAGLDRLGAAADGVFLRASNAADPRVRLAAMTARARRGDREALAAVHAALQAEASRVRLLALDHLADLASPFSEAALAACLQDPVAEVRVRAARALGGLSGPGLTQALAHALDDPAPRVRAAAAVALHRQGGLGMSARMRVQLAADSGPARVAAARALGQMRAEEAVDALAEALADTNLEVACTAAEALGQVAAENPLADAPAATALVRGLSADRAAVRAAAAHALQAIFALPFLTDPAGALRELRAQEPPPVS